MNPVIGVEHLQHCLLLVLLLPLMSKPKCGLMIASIVMDSMLRELFVHMHLVRYAALDRENVIQSVLINASIVQTKVTWKKIAH